MDEVRGSEPCRDLELQRARSLSLQHHEKISVVHFTQCSDTAPAFLAFRARRSAGKLESLLIRYRLTKDVKSPSVTPCPSKWHRRCAQTGKLQVSHLLEETNHFHSMSEVFMSTCTYLSRYSLGGTILMRDYVQMASTLEGWRPFRSRFADSSQSFIAFHPPSPASSLAWKPQGSVWRWPDCHKK